MSLFIDKPDSMQNEIIYISADELAGNEPYTFRLILKHNYGTHKSEATFKSDPSGHIDLATSKPLRGTYHDADPMGLFMSLLPCEDFAFGGYLRCTPPVPFIYRLQLLDDIGRIVDELFIKKHWMHPSLTRLEIEDEFCGTLFKPPGDGPFPCVIDLSGTGGGIHEHKGSMLASEGFVVLCVPFFQYKNLPKLLPDVDINYFKAPINYLISLPYTQNVMGIQGVSFGALVVEHLAARHPQITAVVSINGPPACIEYLNMKEDGKTMPLTYVDDTAAFVNGILETWQSMRVITDHITKESEIPWDRIPKETSFRIIGSVDDLCQPSVHCTHYRQRRLKETGHNVEIELVSGGHIMEPPYFPHHELVFAKFQGFYCGYGGEVVLHGKSQEKTWTNTINFFAKTLGKPAVMPDWDRLSVVGGPIEERSHL